MSRRVTVVPPPQVATQQRRARGNDKLHRIFFRDPTSGKPVQQDIRGTSINYQIGDSTEFQSGVLEIRAGTRIVFAMPLHYVIMVYELGRVPPTPEEVSTTEDSD